MRGAFVLKKICTITFCLLIILFGRTSVFALEFATTPEQTDLGDGLVFWMTLPDDERLGHPASGLYRNGEILYTVDVDGNWWWAQLYFSDDAMSFLFVPLIGGERSTVRFYDKGILVHEHNVLSLLEGGADSLIPPYEILTFYRWDLYRDHDRANNILRITTAENTIVSFDLSTGEIISTEPAENEPTQNDYNSTDAILPAESVEEELIQNSYKVIIAIGIGVVACAIITVLFTIIKSKRNT